MDDRFSIRLARDIFKKRFEEDEDFRYGYQANIAMLLHDRYGITDHKERNDAANDIMAVIFDAKEFKKKKKYKTEDRDRFELLDI